MTIRADDGKWSHGTPYGYMGRGCRCEECRRAHRDYQRAKYRRTHPEAPGRTLEDRSGWRVRMRCDCGRLWTAVPVEQVADAGPRARRVCPDCRPSTVA